PGPQAAASRPSTTRMASAARSSTASTTQAGWSASTTAPTATPTGCWPPRSRNQRSAVKATRPSQRCADLQVETVLGDRLGQHFWLDLALARQLAEHRKRD